MDQNKKSLDDRQSNELSLDGSGSEVRSPGYATSQVHVDLAAATHPGHVRENNEDHYLTIRFRRSLETLSTNVEDGVLPASFEETGYGMLVADGMGGMSGGEVASRLALCKLVELVVNTPDWHMKLNQKESVETVAARMTERFVKVDNALREHAEKDSSLLGMGTTLTVAVTLGSDLFIGHAGDSRAYLLRANELHQLTRDHTLAQVMIDAGVAQPDDPATHAMRHVLTAALGSPDEQVAPEVQRLNLSDGDQLLLCTDGLTEMLDDRTIGSVLNQAKSSQDGCQALIDLALSGGGTDNVTVVLARYRFPASGWNQI